MQTDRWLSKAGIAGKVGFANPCYALLKHNFTIFVLFLCFLRWCRWCQSVVQGTGGRSNVAATRLGPAQAVRVSRLDPTKPLDLARLALAVYFRCVCLRARALLPTSRCVLYVALRVAP